jgi:carbamoyl-phosphate synthase small subunit
VDTRALTARIRDGGAPSGVLVFPADGQIDLAAAQARAAAWPGLEGMDLAKTVSCTQSYEWDETEWVFPTGTGKQTAPKHHVVAVDYGAKRNILRCLAAAGFRVTVVPATSSAEDILRHKPDGVFLSNGPGDPAATAEYAVPAIRGVLDTNVPVFGICLGHQLLSLALGAKTYKLARGHRGANQPVKDLDTGKVEITSQNHGFCVDFAALGELDRALSGGLDLDPADIGAWVEAGVAPVVTSPRFGPVQLTHVNLNDMTVEGVRALEQQAFSVQYHPEAAPGPHDARYLFDAFARLMQGKEDVFAGEDEV